MAETTPSEAMRTVVVRQGDHVARVAAREGLDADEVWEHPANAELRAARRHPGCLLPGDVLRVPAGPSRAMPLRGGQTNVFVARVPTVLVRVRILHRGEALGDADYEVHGLGRPHQGRTDAEGRVSFECGTEIERAVVRFPSRKLSMTLELGHLDPATTPSGVYQRLANLGYVPRGRRGGHRAPLAVDGAEEWIARRALRRLQRDHGLPETGAVDQATLSVLVRRHGV